MPFNIYCFLPKRTFDRNMQHSPCLNKNVQRNWICSNILQVQPFLPPQKQKRVVCWRLWWPQYIRNKDYIWPDWMWWWGEKQEIHGYKLVLMVSWLIGSPFTIFSMRSTYSSKNTSFDRTSKNFSGKIPVFQICLKDKIRDL